MLNLLKVANHKTRSHLLTIFGLVLRDSWHKYIKLQPPTDKLVPFVWRLLEAFKIDLELKLGEFWKIQEILHLIGTEILQFGPREAEILEFKEGWGLKSFSSQRE